MKNSLFATAKVLTAGLLMCLGSTVPSVATAGEKVAVANLPPPVISAILHHYPTARIVEAEWETEDGRGYYEVELEVNGKDIDLEISPEGRILKKD